MATATLPVNNLFSMTTDMLPELKLPPGAPKVKLTAQIGPVRQQSWYLRRPITIIGSTPTAHIRILDGEVSKLHCVIVNTGTHVLVRDLGSGSGTLLNERPIDLACVSDGDTLTIGGVTALIAIQSQRGNPKGADENDGLPFADPLRMPIELMLRETDGAEPWPITDAVTTVGGNEDRGLFLDQPDGSPTHVIMTHVGGKLVVCDLESQTGTHE